MEIRTARGTCGFVSGQGRPYPLSPQRPGWCRGKGTLYSADTIGIERHNSLHRQLSSHVSTWHGKALRSMSTQGCSVQTGLTRSHWTWLSNQGESAGT